MKFLKSILIFLAMLSSIASFAQNTTSLTGTIQDPYGQAWSYATVTANLFVPGGGTASFLSGGQVPLSYGPFVLNSTGAFNSASVANASATTPSNIQWSFTVCPNISAPCQTIRPISISGSTFNLGSVISAAITNPTIQAAKLVYAYNANEITGPFNGAGYVNTNSGIQYWYCGTTWCNLGVGVSLPVPIVSGGTGNTTASAGAAALINGNPIAPSSSASTGLTTGSNLFSANTGFSITNLASGLTSAVCTSGFTCTSKFGFITVTGGTYAGGSAAFTVNWSPTPTSQSCILSQSAGTAWYGWALTTVPTTTGFTPFTSQSLSGVTTYLQYYCQPNF
jgi:hypothetical protein